MATEEPAADVRTNVARVNDDATAVVNRVWIADSGCRNLNCDANREYMLDVY